MPENVSDFDIAFEKIFGGFDGFFIFFGFGNYRIESEFDRFGFGF